MSLDAIDALSLVLQRESRRTKDPSRALVRVTGSAKGWAAAVGHLTPTGSGVAITTVTLDHLDDTEAWRALLEKIRGGAP